MSRLQYFINILVYIVHISQSEEQLSVYSFTQEMALLMYYSPSHWSPMLHIEQNCRQHYKLSKALYSMVVWFHFMYNFTISIVSYRHNFLAIVTMEN